MSITFRLTPHTSKPGVMICEIFVGGRFVGALYPEEPNSVRLFSSHLEGEEGILRVFHFEP
jgi:hypothetical protein